MAQIRRLHPLLTAGLLSMLLAACGGGGGGGGGSTGTLSSEQQNRDLAQQTNAPSVTGNMATDGFNWFNYRRQQIGLQPLARSSVIEAAARGHSEYQRINDVITHEQIQGKPGFTGVTVLDRLRAAGYPFNTNYGEVISATGHSLGFSAAESLITAIYHRYVIFEPRFDIAGSATATVPNGYTYFTTNFGVNGAGASLPQAGFVTYPVADQRNVAPNFFSDQEVPDPVPDKNEVGYPVSIHTDGFLTVQSFTLRRNGSPVPVRLLTAQNDEAHTPRSAAAIVPLDVLATGTTYEVQFSGTVDGQAVSRTWSFTTR